MVQSCAELNTIILTLKHYNYHWGASGIVDFSKTIEQKELNPLNAFWKMAGSDFLEILNMSDSMSAVTTKLWPSSFRCFLSSLKVLNDTTVGCGFSRTSSKSSFSCWGRDEFALANNCLAFSLNLSPTSKAVAIVFITSNPVTEDRF